MSNSKNYKSVLAADLTLLLVAFFWGAGFPLSAFLARTVSPLWAVALRMGLSALLFIILFPKVIFKSSLYDLKLAFSQALIFTVIFVSMTFGLMYSTASKQAFIGGLYVIFTPLLAWGVFKIRPSKWLFGGALITTIGALIMGFTPGMEFNFGDLLSLLMSFSLAVQILAAGYCTKRMDPVRLASLHVIMLSVVLTVIAMLREPLPNLSAFTFKTWGALLFVSALNTVLCFILQFKAQRVTSASHAAVIFSLESFFGFLTSVVCGQDPFNFQCAAGGMLMIAGVLLTEAEEFFKSR